MLKQYQRKFHKALEYYQEALKIEERNTTPSMVLLEQKIKLGLFMKNLIKSNLGYSDVMIKLGKLFKMH